MIKGLRPGGFKLADRAVKLCRFQEGSRLLDVGCGRGETAAYLHGKGYDISGVDINNERIVQGKAKNPHLELLTADGCCLPFDENIFDGVLMECSLPCIYNRAEALHEAYCVLKKGGFLVIHAPYLKTPDKRQLELLSNLKKGRKFKSREKEGCLTMEELAERDRCGLDGVLLLEPVVDTLQEIGFSISDVEDHTQYMNQFIIEFILNGAEHEDERRELQDDCLYYRKIHGMSGVGYFLLTARKE